jgi:hypothetical protein
MQIDKVVFIRDNKIHHARFLTAFYNPVLSRRLRKGKPLPQRPLNGRWRIGVPQNLSLPLVLSSLQKKLGRSRSTRYCTGGHGLQRWQSGGLAKLPTSASFSLSPSQILSTALMSSVRSLAPSARPLSSPTSPTVASLACPLPRVCHGARSMPVLVLCTHSTSHRPLS